MQNPNLEDYITEFKFVNGQNTFGHLSNAELKEHYNPLNVYAFYKANWKKYNEEPYFILLTNSVSGNMNSYLRGSIFDGESLRKFIYNNISKLLETKPGITPERIIIACKQYEAMINKFDN